MVIALNPVDFSVHFLEHGFNCCRYYTSLLWTAFICNVRNLTLRNMLGTRKTVANAFCYNPLFLRTVFIRLPTAL